MSSPNGRTHTRWFAHHPSLCSCQLVTLLIIGQWMVTFASVVFSSPDFLGLWLPHDCLSFLVCSPLTHLHFKGNETWRFKTHKNSSRFVWKSFYTFRKRHQTSDKLDLENVLFITVYCANVQTWARWTDITCTLLLKSEDEGRFLSRVLPHIVSEFFSLRLAHHGQISFYPDVCRAALPISQSTMQIK